MEWTLLLLLLLTCVHCGGVTLDIEPEPVTVGGKVELSCATGDNKWEAAWYMDGALVYKVLLHSRDCSEVYKGKDFNFEVNRTCEINIGPFDIIILNVTASLNNTIWHCSNLEGNSSVKTLEVRNQPIVNLTITPMTVTEGSNLNMSCSSRKENDGDADWYEDDELVLKSENKADGCFVDLKHKTELKDLVTCHRKENKIVLSIRNVPAALNNTRWHCDMNGNQASKKIQLTVDFGGHVNLTCTYSADLAGEKITWTRKNITVTELRSSGGTGCNRTTIVTDFKLNIHCSLNYTKFTLEIFDVREVLNDTTWMCIIEVTETTTESTTSNYTQNLGLAGSLSPSFLIPVLVGLGVFIFVVAVAAAVVRYKRRAKPGAAGAAKQKQDDNVKQPVNRESLVIQENELYCSSDNLTADAGRFTQLKDGGGEMPDTSSPLSTSDSNKLNKTHKDSLVLQDNCLYESSEY